MPQTSPPSLSSDVPACPSVSEVLAASDESPSDDQVKTELHRTSNWLRICSSAKESRGFRASSSFGSGRQVRHLFSSSETHTHFCQLLHIN